MNVGESTTASFSPSVPVRWPAGAGGDPSPAGEIVPVARGKARPGPHAHSTAVHATQLESLLWQTNMSKRSTVSFPPAVAERGPPVPVQAATRTRKTIRRMWRLTVILCSLLRMHGGENLRARLIPAQTTPNHPRDYATGFIRPVDSCKCDHTGPTHTQKTPNKPLCALMTCELWLQMTDRHLHMNRTHASCCGFVPMVAVLS